MPRSIDRHVWRALLYWERGRKLEDEGSILRAAQCYTRGLGGFLSYVKLSQQSELVPAYYAFGALARETTRVCTRLTPLLARQNARMALATSHLADPTRGDVTLIEQAVREHRDRPLHQFVLGPGKPLLTAEMRIAGAAEARDLLASLLNNPSFNAPRKAQGLWPIGSGRTLGKGMFGYWEEKKRYMQAVLPSCAGLDERQERDRLREEADAIFTELLRVSPGFDPGHRRRRPRLG
jgi:hypothetical protein